ENAALLQLVVVQLSMTIDWEAVLLYCRIGDQAMSTPMPLWFKIARVMSFPVLESTKPIGFVELTVVGIPTLFTVLNGAQPAPGVGVLEHTSIGCTAT